MDLHTQGIYCVLDPDGAPLLDTVESTGYSARATFCRTYNKRWSTAQAAGYLIARLDVVEVSSPPLPC